jgi:hypothetical protein
MSPSRKRKRNSQPSTGAAGPVAKPPKPATGLSALPDELLVNVLNNFLGPPSAKGDKHELLSLCLTSRQFYILAKPYLYNGIDNHLWDEGKILDTLTLNPQLASEIKHLSFHDHDLGLSQKRVEKLYIIISQTQRIMLCKKAEELGFVHLQTFKIALDTPNQNFHLAALLLLASGIQSLDIYVNYFRTYDRDSDGIPLIYFRILSEACFNKSPLVAQHFQHLHTIQIKINEVHNREIGPILGIKSLRTLSLKTDLHLYKEPIRHVDSRPRSSPLEHLSIQGYRCNQIAAAEIIHEIKNLRSLKLRSTMTEDGEGSLTLMKAVLEHKDSLEKLSIDHYRVMRNPAYTPFPCLHDLRKTRDLAVGLDYFMKVGTMDEDHFRWAQKLPRGLTRLLPHLGQTDKVFWKLLLESLIMECKENLLDLKEFAVSGWRDGTDVLIPSVREMVESVGVKMVVVIRPRTWDMKPHEPLVFLS